MLTYQNNIVRTSVRKMVEFLLRSGDITSKAALTADPEAMQEGSRLHRKIQKAQGASYQSEVPLKMTWHEEKYDLALEGRADGIDSDPDIPKDSATITDAPAKRAGPDPDIPGGQIEGMEGSLCAKGQKKRILIDEIKCVCRDVSQIEEPDPLHLAQAKCYAYMYGAQNGLTEMLVRITYCNIATEDTRSLIFAYSTEELEEWFHELTDACRLWADYYVESREKRNQSIGELAFPFPYRPGQRKMSAVVYHTLGQGQSIFLQALTGIGKTVSTLYPALKQMGEGRAEKIFYLTARTTARQAAEHTLGLLHRQNLVLRSVTMTAREKICVGPKEDSGPECNPAFCDRARGHYDRINTALYALLTEQERIGRRQILDYSEQYQVCPYELSAEAAEWADCVICDYNYVFDPHVSVKKLQGEGSGKQCVYLIDEAHNLLDRARDMYSAGLCRGWIQKAWRWFRGKNQDISRKLSNCLTVFRKLEKAPEEAESLADGFYYPLLRLLGPLEDYLADHPDFEEREEMVRFFFLLRHFFMIYENKTQGYQVYADGEGKDLTVRLLCVDPSACIKDCLEKGRAAVFFSATLLPIQYYRRLLGGSADIPAFAVPSPFAGEQKLLAITSDVTSRYSQRGEAQYRRIVAYLEATIRHKPGNYMIFFPSYKMLHACALLAAEGSLPAEADLLIQEPMMGEKEREEFLAAFREDREGSLIGFCVLGSIFSEGVDLAGRRLIGALIVGTGLPQVCKEREMIRSYFDTDQKKGYDYAYRYPGMNKILQAAGRVIRTAGDVGIVALMDDRFLLKENQALLPDDWDRYYEVNLRTYPRVLEAFWGKYNDEVR